MIGQKYGTEVANPVGPNGCYLTGTYPLLDGKFVFKANDLIVDLLREKGALLHVESSCTAIRAAGATRRRSSSAPRRNGSSAWIRKACVSSRWKDQKGVQWIPDWGGRASK